MIRFLLHRLYISVLVAITVSVIAFGLLRLSGDLAAELAGEDATPEEIAVIAKQYGLDKPLHVQYFNWAGNALAGDLGRSLFTNEPVTEMILDRIGVTVKLAFLSILVALVISIPLGVLASVYPNTLIDRVSLGLAVFGQAIPNFFFALLLILLFGVQLRWYPISGNETFAHFIMPTLFDSHEQFAEWFSKGVEGSVTNGKELNEHQLARLHAVLKPFMLRRLKTDVLG